MYMNRTYRYTTREFSSFSLSALTFSPLFSDCMGNSISLRLHLPTGCICCDDEISRNSSCLDEMRCQFITEINSENNHQYSILCFSPRMCGWTARKKKASEHNSTTSIRARWFERFFLQFVCSRPAFFFCEKGLGHSNRWGFPSLGRKFATANRKIVCAVGKREHRSSVTSDWTLNTPWKKSDLSVRSKWLTQPTSDTKCAKNHRRRRIKYFLKVTRAVKINFKLTVKKKKSSNKSRLSRKLNFS